MTSQPNPVRNFESHALIDQTADDYVTCPNGSHYFQTLKTSSPDVPYVEQCRDCKMVDSASLQWWSDNRVKTALSARAARIAVTAESQPFAFSQPSDGDITLEEVLGQALGAASVAWEDMPSGVFDSSRAKVIFDALLREVERFIALDRRDAGKRLASWMMTNGLDVAYSMASDRVVRDLPASTALPAEPLTRTLLKAYNLLGQATAADPQRLEEWLADFGKLHDQISKMMPRVSGPETDRQVG